MYDICERATVCYVYMRDVLAAYFDKTIKESEWFHSKSYAIEQTRTMSIQSSRVIAHGIEQEAGLCRSFLRPKPYNSTMRNGSTWEASKVCREIFRKRLESRLPS